MKDIGTRKILKAAVPLILALISFFIVSKYASSTDFHAKTIQSLDDKKKTVMELTAASTAASAAISLLPGDAATPIAEKLTDLSTCFLLVLCAIYLEKYLVTITGYAAFKLLIPIGCVLLSVSFIAKGPSWRKLAKKLIIFGIVISFVIPSSVKLSDMIENTYESSIEKTLENATETTKEIENAAEDDDSEKNILSGFISKVKEGVSGATSKVESVLSNFIEALAVMLVTSCIIPILVLLFFVWLVKIILGVDIPLPQRRELRP